MCDYSLTAVQSRSANEGERLVVHRFHNGVMGFVSQNDSCAIAEAQAGVWGKLISWLVPTRTACAVCLEPGARLMLRDLPLALRSELKLECDEEVTFTQAGSPHAYRDAIKFRQGTEILIQRLPKGLVADVLALASGDRHDEAPQVSTLELHEQEAGRR